MKAILTLILSLAFTFVSSQDKIAKPVIVIKKDEIKPKLEVKKNIPKKNKSKPNQNLERERIEAEERAELERIAEIERQNRLAEEKRKAEELRKNKEVYDKHLKWSKNMIETNGINSCKNDIMCRKQVIEKLKLALTYYEGSEAKNLLIQIQ